MHRVATMTKKKETDYYPEICKYISDEILANIENQKDIIIHPIQEEISAALKTLLLNNRIKTQNLRDFANTCHRLHIDIALVIENKANELFEIIIFEVKKTKTLGLTQLSQLIGYCLVSNASFGILINIDNGCSDEFKAILNNDKDLTHIQRLKNGQAVEHNFGVMIWQSQTVMMSYTNEGKILSIPMLCQLLSERLNPTPTPT